MFQIQDDSYDARPLHVTVILNQLNEFILTLAGTRSKFHQHSLKICFLSEAADGEGNGKEHT